jgi:hypothetical protein
MFVLCVIINQNVFKQNLFRDLMDEEKKEEVKENQVDSVSSVASVKTSNLTENVRKNPWLISTLVLGILVVILLVTTFSGTLTGNAVSKNTAATNLVDYAKLQGIDVLVNGVSEESGLYSLDVSIDGQNTSLFVTKDGKNIVNGLIPMITSTSDTNTKTQTTEVPKTEKPVVELYVFTYCPYGLQMEKATIPVVKLLGDKIDFKIRQIGAMHGDFEKVEAERQLCIEKNYPSKFLDYVLAFAGDTSCSSGADTCLTSKLNNLYSQFGIDASKINSCMTSEGQALYDAEVSNSESKGVTGSPTLIINGVETQSSRNEEAVKGVICEAFTSVPTQCSQKLSTSSASAGFGNASSSSNSSASCS